MDTLLIVAAIVLGVVGIVGSVVPGLPGPPMGWLGLLLAYLAGGTNGDGEAMTTFFLIVWLLVTAVVTVLDYVVPGMFTKLTGGSKYAGRGAIIGLFAGMFIPPVGIILGSLIGAFLAEIVFAGKDPVSSVTSAFGAFLGFLCGTGIKLIASGLMLYYIFVYI
ncbi:MAG: DUF456 domain-containing protein [Bacteroidales bacterium]|nr:DUF456 domain-containing protein [Bacteroidales bacterium]